MMILKAIMTYSDVFLAYPGEASGIIFVDKYFTINI